MPYDRSEYPEMSRDDLGANAEPAPEVRQSDFEALRMAIEQLQSRLDNAQMVMSGDPVKKPSSPTELALEKSSGRFESPGFETDRAQLLEKKCKAAVRDREIATALSGRALVSGAAAQLMRLWRDELDVIETEDDFKVITRDGRTLAEAVTEWLSAPEFAHFSLPTTRGGIGAGDATRPERSSQGGEKPRNLGEIIIQKWREDATVRSNMDTKVIGLRRFR